MRKRQSSLTAAGIAVVRAIESAKPEGERIIYDPYARQFAGAFLYHIISAFDKLGYSEWRGPGVMGFLVTRERYIDDTLRRSLDEGLEQLVILGAGYDARAYRFEALKSGVKVFEVDHPATQEAKVKKLKKIFGAIPSHVTYVPIDFNEQTLEARLFESNYDPSLTTLFILQGVTPYLAPEGVDSTLAFVADHSKPGSAIVFDYMYTSLLDGTVTRGEVKKMRRDRWLSGEALSFGLPEGTVKAFLEARGFTEVTDADHNTLRQTYFPDGSRTVAYGYAVATAKVKGR